MAFVYYPEDPLHPPFVLEVPAASLFLYSLFPSTSYLVASFFFARSFLSRGMLHTLLLGSGVLVMGFGFPLSQILGGYPTVNPNLNLGIGLVIYSSAGIMLSTFATSLMLGKEREVRRRRMVLFMSYLGSIAVVFGVVLLFEAGLMPVFFVAGQGPAPVRTIALGVVIASYFYASLALLRSYRKSRELILIWFLLALASVGVGTISALLVRAPFGAFIWLARTSASLSGAYVIISVIQAFRRR